MAVAGRALAPGPRRALEALGVEVLGYVESLEKFYASTRVVIAPYRLGGGVRLKVLEALTYGKPVVGTALAFRGISGAGGFPSADDAPQLIAGVIEVLEDFARADHLAKLAQASVMDGHGPASSKAAAEAFIEAFRSSPCRGGF
jgi:glycosyltransferase involved in cell wall biosynthesis